MLNRFTDDYLESLASTGFAPQAKVSGRLASFDGLLMEAVGLQLSVGTVCQVGSKDAGVEAEVIGFRNGRTLLMNLGGPAALLAKDHIRSQEVVAFPELGMEAVWKITVENFPAFILVDNKGNDFFQQINNCPIC